MVSEVIVGRLEDVRLFIPPAIPLAEKIEDVLPGWNVIEQNNRFSILAFKDNTRLINLYKGKTEVSCFGEQGQNSQNLKVLRDAILEISSISKKKDDAKKRLRKGCSREQITYGQLPIEIKNAELDTLLKVFRGCKSIDHLMPVHKDGSVYSFGKNKFVVALAEPYDNFLSRGYAEITEKLVFTGKPNRKMDFYIS